MKEETDKAWKELEKLVLTGTQSNLAHKKCPSCGGGLRIGYVPGNQAAVGIRCTKCYSRVWLDGILTIPPWAESTGYEFET